jgi:hypothetical protein
MRLGDALEVIDEPSPAYRRRGYLVDFTRTGRLVLELDGPLRIQVDPHQVDVAGPMPADAWPTAMEALAWFAG